MKSGDLDSYHALGYLHKDFPSIQRDLLVPDAGKPFTTLQ